MATLHELHIAMVEAVNNARTEHEHYTAQQRLWAWRDGARAAGREPNLIAADMHYIDQGYEGEMCCGVKLDWRPDDR